MSRLQKTILLLGGFFLFLSMVLPGINMANEKEANYTQIKTLNLGQSTDKLDKDKKFWKQHLTDLQYDVCREGGTERAFTGKYDGTQAKGDYSCSNCGQKLFAGEAKFDSGSGWPSFYQPVSPAMVSEHTDRKFGMSRTEIKCSRCDAHLGHVFNDGPKPTGKRYCMNSVCLVHDQDL